MNDLKRAAFKLAGEAQHVMSHFQVAQEMILARGYTIVEYQFEKCLKASAVTDNDVIVIFLNQKFTIMILKELFIEYDVSRYLDFIIVTPSYIPSNIRKASNINPNIEIFLEKELSFNILKHHLQPQMRKIPLKHKDFWPIMLETDAVAKFMKWKNEDFIEIKRRDGSVSYRIVRKV